MLLNKMENWQKKKEKEEEEEEDEEEEEEEEEKLFYGIFTFFLIISAILHVIQFEFNHQSFNGKFAFLTSL